MNFIALNKLTIKIHYKKKVDFSRSDLGWLVLHKIGLYSRLSLGSYECLIHLDNVIQNQILLIRMDGHAFGLTNALAIVVRLIIGIFRPCSGRFLFIYVDDIILFSSS